MLDIVGVQGVRWEGSGTELAGKSTSVYGKGMRIVNYVEDFLCIRESYQQLSGLSIGLSYIILRGTSLFNIFIPQQTIKLMMCRTIIRRTGKSVR
jgi:hypothetical protein